MYLELVYFICSVVFVLDVFLWIRQRLYRTHTLRPPYTVLSSLTVNDNCTNVNDGHTDGNNNNNHLTSRTHLHNEHESSKCGDKQESAHHAEMLVKTNNTERKVESVLSETDNTVSNTSNVCDAVVTYDYVVIGAGPAGLAASYELLTQTKMEHHNQYENNGNNNTCHQASPVSVLLIERGKDPLPSSGVGQVCETLSRSRLVSLAPECVRIPIRTLPTEPIDLTLKRQLSTIDAGCTVQRPLRELTLHREEQESIIHTTENKASDQVDVAENNNSNNNNVNSNCESAAAAVIGCKVQRTNLPTSKEVINCYTPYPRGCGVGGTSLLDWALELPSFTTSGNLLEEIMPARATVRASFARSNKTGTSASTLPFSFHTDSEMLSQCKPHPVSVAFCDAMKSVLSETTSLSNSMQKQKECKVNNNKNKKSSNNNNNNNNFDNVEVSKNDANDRKIGMTNLPLRMDGYGRRLPIVTSHVFTDQSEPNNIYSTNNKDQSMQNLLHLHVLHKHKVVDFILTHREPESEHLSSEELHELNRKNTIDQNESIERAKRYSISAVIVAASSFHSDTLTSKENVKGTENIEEFKCVRVNVRRGVVVAAGVVCSPRLVYRMLSKYKLIDHTSLCVSKIKDALALPIIVQAHHGISRDACNSNEWKCWMQWIRQESGPWSLPLTEAMVSMPVPECGPAATLHIFCFAFGGRDASRFYQMGWDRLLASFTEAMTFLIVVDGVDGMHFPLSLSDDLCHFCKSNTHRSYTKEVETSSETQSKLVTVDVTDNACTSSSVQSMSKMEPVVLELRQMQHENQFTVTIMQEMRRRGMRPLHDVESVDVKHAHFTQETINRLHVAFARGIKLCRQAARTPPLSHLLTGHEAIDGTLLSKKDAHKALELTKLLHLPPIRINKRVSQRASELMKWASEIAENEEYVYAYIDTHAYWLGFGSGSSAPFVHETLYSDRNALNKSNSNNNSINGNYDNNTIRKTNANWTCFVKGVDNCVIGDTSVIHVNDDHHNSCSALKQALIAGNNSSAIDAGKEAVRLLVQCT